MATSPTAAAAQCERPVAFVTGASSGIGRATALAVAARGARVVVGTFADDVHDANEVVDLIRTTGGECVLADADVRDEHALRRACLDAVDRWGGLDWVVANAATMGR